MSGPPRGREEVIRRLRELGHVDGKTVAYEFRYADNKFEGLPALADELVRLKVDLLIAPGAAGALASKKATKTIPIVFLDVTDPVAAGIVASLARPGGNITGLTNVTMDLAGKRLELLKEIVPKLSRVAVLRDLTNVTEGSVGVIEATARELKLQTQRFEVARVEDFDRQFQAIMKWRPDGLTGGGGPLMNGHRKRFVEFATKNKLPVVHSRDEFVDAGGLASYATSNIDLSRRAATYVDKILKGRKPTDLPVEQPIKFEFIVNLKAAKQIGLTIPPNVLVRAGRVIR